MPYYGIFVSYSWTDVLDNIGFQAKTLSHISIQPYSFQLYMAVLGKM